MPGSDPNAISARRAFPTSSVVSVEAGFQRAVEDEDDLFAGVLVPDGGRRWEEVDAVLDDHASGDAEVVLLQIGAPESGRLLDVVTPVVVLMRTS